MDRQELIGQIIDIFEDELTSRNIVCYGNDPKPTEALIPLHFEDEDSNGVFYGGNYYDKVAAKIEKVLTEWKLLNSEKTYPRLYIVQSGEKWCVSTSKDECYCDEEIWLALKIPEEKFYELSRKHRPNYYFHTFDYGNTDEKEVCDTTFNQYYNAVHFAHDLIEEASKCMN